MNEAEEECIKFKKEKEVGECSEAIKQIDQFLEELSI